MTYKYSCTVCPFKTSDAAGKQGHEDYLLTNPRGWLGHGEAHTMEVVCPTCIAQGSGMGPSHNASRRCESGRRDHCTCDTCF